MGPNPYSERYKTPAHEHQFALTGVAIEADNRLEGLWRYVPARPEVGQQGAMNGEALGNALLVRMSNVSSAHGNTSSR
jgi:hypothetical protein